MFDKVVVLCLYLLIGPYVIAQEGGKPCRTPNQTSGVCILIKQCNSLYQLVLSGSGNTSIRNYLLASTCLPYVRGQEPLVCCPDSRPRNQPPPDEITPISPNIEIVNLPKPPYCGSNNLSSSRVVGGQPAKLGEFPWMVALGYRNRNNPNMPKWLCGGSLITDRHILTAGHCVHRRTDLYTARLGDLDLYDDNDGASPENIDLQEVKLHEDYDPVKFTSDIAIVVLKRATTNPTVRPICLPFEEPLRSETYLKKNPWVAGWGAIFFRGPSSSILQIASLPVIANENCQKAYADKTTIDNRIICAGYPGGDKDACQGDSGGPLMNGKVASNKAIFYQIGVVSYGFRCAEPGWPGVYTRVTHFIDWIAKNVNN